MLLRKLNGFKCRYTSFGIGRKNNDFIFEVINLPNSCEEKKLGLITDNELKFNPHIKSMCNKVAQKLGVLNRIC